MTLEIAFVLAVLGLMVVLFLTEKLPIEVTAFLGLGIFLFTEFVTPAEAFTGFASPAVITMLMVFVLSAALQQTGVADWLGRRLQAAAAGREELLLLVIMLTAGALSAFMNNVAATAVLLPAVAAVARRSALPPSRLFLPLSFGAILGGTTTLVGTPPNLLTAEVLLQRKLEPFELFDFTPLGIALLLLGVLFMLTLGRRMLPDRSVDSKASRGADLSNLYGLEERLFSLRVPLGSPLDRLTLSQARFGTALNVQVVAILRGDEKKLAPGPQEEIRGGDLLLVTGRLSDLTELLRVQRVEVHESGVIRLRDASERVAGLCLRLVEGSELVGQTLAEARFRKRFGLVVADIRRQGEALMGSLARQELAVGDELLALGSKQDVGEIYDLPQQFEVVQAGSEALARLEQSLFLVSVLKGSPLVGRSLAESRIGELVGLTIVAVLRETENLATPAAEDMFEEGDELLVAGESGHILALLRMAGIDVESETPTPTLESEEVGVVEAIVAPRSEVAGHTLSELGFRERYGLQVLAIWRHQRRLRSGLARQVLGFGDALLLQGAWTKIALLARDPDFVVLADALPTTRRTHKAPYAFFALALMIGLVVSRQYPIQVAAFAAAVVVLLSRTLTPEEAYRAIEWRAIFLVAAILPAGVAMERSGAALYLAQSLTSLAGDWGPYATLAGLVVLSSLLSQGLDGAPTVVLLAPVVFHSAEELSLSPYPLLMGVGLAASAAFMTPFSHKANLLVMGAGGYRTVDYLRVGTPLTVVVLIVLVVLVPVFFPF